MTDEEREARRRAHIEYEIAAALKPPVDDIDRANVERLRAMLENSAK